MLASLERGRSCPKHRQRLCCRFGAALDGFGFPLHAAAGKLCVNKLARNSDPIFAPTSSPLLSPPAARSSSLVSASSCFIGSEAPPPRVRTPALLKDKKLLGIQTCSSAVLLVQSAPHQLIPSSLPLSSRHRHHHRRSLCCAAATHEEISKLIWRRFGGASNQSIPESKQEQDDGLPAAAVHRKGPVLERHVRKFLDGWSRSACEAPTQTTSPFPHHRGVVPEEHDEQEEDEALEEEQTGQLSVGGRRRQRRRRSLPPVQLLAPVVDDDRRKREEMMLGLPYHGPPSSSSSSSSPSGRSAAAANPMAMEHPAAAPAATGGEGRAVNDILSFIGAGRGGHGAFKDVALVATPPERSAFDAMAVRRLQALVRVYVLCYYWLLMMLGMEKMR